MRDEELLSRINFQAWLNGFYIARAVACNLSKDASYYDTPIDFKQPAKPNPEGFKAFMELYNEKHFNKQGGVTN